MAWARNNIVHPRPSPDQDPPLRNATLQAHRAALRYLELALLRLFDHQGDYVNWPEGFGSGRRLDECTEPVPWANRASRP